MKASFHAVADAVPRVSRFEITSQRRDRNRELATLLQLHLDRRRCRSVLSSAHRSSPAPAANGGAETRASALNTMLKSLNRRA